MNILIILPTQLFDIKYIKEVDNINKLQKIILWEHPHYFKKYNYNKKKLMLHRASMKYYYDYLKSKKFVCEYVEFSNKFIKNKKNKYYIFDPIDNLDIEADIIIESPNFLLTRENYSEYRKKTDKFSFRGFYNWGKNIVDIIPKVKSKDKYNRQKIPKNLKIPKLPKILKKDEKYIKEAKTYVEKYFKDNYGNTDNFIYPISHKSAEKWKLDFIKKKLENFGPYQDFIFKEEPYLYHSCLSSSINIGLLCPSDIIEYLKPLQKKYNINSYEGYIRQLFWREYQRYTFLYCNFDVNYFGNNKKLTKEWYNGTLGVKPVDDYIKIAFDTGYLHHIIRLMLIGNFMNLFGIDPQEGFKWFMEFSIDSYEWVMKQNVLDMVFFVTGGKTMRKPYASSSNYIINMSTYNNGPWSKKWDNLYLEFMRKHKEKLWKFRYHFPGLKNL